MTLQKRSIHLSGHGTSLALEPAFWAVLERMAAEAGLSLAAVLASVDAGRGGAPLASSCRLAALAHLQGKLADIGDATVTSGE